MALIPMLRRGGALAAVLALFCGQSAAMSDRTRRKMEFVRAMQEATKAEERAKLRKEAQNRMYRRLLSKAVPSQANHDGTPDFLRVDPKADFQSKHAPPAPTSMTPRKLEDGAWDNFGFDPADYSLKFAGCSAIAMYSDDMADDEESTSVFSTKRFVVFRMCPSDQCSSGSCEYNYGEYLIPLDDYLEYYGVFKEEMFESYCEYCEQCMYFEKYFYGNRGLDDGDDAAGDDQAGDDYYAGDDQAANDDDSEEVHACKYYNECTDYLQTCNYDEWREYNGYDDDSYEKEEEIDYTEFFECQQFEDENGNSYYIAPMCSSDGSNIEFGLFSDENCANYVGNKVDISDFTGMNFGEDVLADYASDDCISCLESDLPFMIVNRDADDNDDITELCENLYSLSAKCNTHLWQASDGSYMSYNQEVNEGLVCGFINNVINGAYDQNGYIKLDADEFDITKINFGELTEASLAQIAGIALVLVGLLALTVWSCFLHRAIQQQAKLVLLPPEQEFVRQESGVMIGRSMSRDFPENPENDHVLT